jgi:steroid 5-alpha reductase family enzyme
VRCALLTHCQLWAIRLTHNYSRREEWTWGAREDFRYIKLRQRFGVHWVWLSFFAQYVGTQWMPEILFSVPYYYIITDSRPTDLIDVACAALALVCLAGAWLSDNSLRQFVEDPSTRGKVLQTGVWAWSRHPNYLSESTFHWATALWALRSAPPLILSGAVLNSLILFITCFLTEAHFLRGERRSEYVKYCNKVRMIL